MKNFKVTFKDVYVHVSVWVSVKGPLGADMGPLEEQSVPNC